jgi:single-strand DNA-binding protein
MNKVFLVGRISSDPILKVTNNGNEVVNVNLAVNDSRNRDQSYFFPCVA